MKIISLHELLNSKAKKSIYKSVMLNLTYDRKPYIMIEAYDDTFLNATKKPSATFDKINNKIIDNLDKINKHYLDNGIEIERDTITIIHYSLFDYHSENILRAITLSDKSRLEANGLTTHETNKGKMYVIF